MARVVIRPYEPVDWPQTWEMLKPVFAAADTYAIDPAISESDAKQFWVDSAGATFVAEVDRRIIGTYYIRDNHKGPGSHVCNAGYVVKEESRGSGIGEALCRHSLMEAKRMGYASMQFNIVAASNVGAVRLWKKMGFEIAGTLPGAFLHPTMGPVDAFVMFRSLIDVERAS